MPPYQRDYRIEFGPGGLTPAVKLILYASIAMFLVTWAVPSVQLYLGLMPQAVIEHWWLWQPVTYMTLHANLFHIVFNMLALWMFGVELERRWGTVYFLRYYVFTGVGAALLTLVVSLLPFSFGARSYYAVTMGASGAIYGLLLAYGIIFANRPIYLYFLFPIPAKYFVMIMAAMTLYSSISDTQGGMAHAAHLGGLVAGWLYLGAPGAPTPSSLWAEVKYRYLRWKMARMRKRFDVHKGGKDGWVH